MPSSKRPHLIAPLASPATMADIANRVGVSKVTVSAVLSASAGNNTRVSEATRQRILEAAREMNYSPNWLAKIFRQNCTGIIGFYLGSGDWRLSTFDMFVAEIVSGLQEGCDEHRKDLLIHGTFRGQSIDDIYLELVNRKIDGLIMFAREGDALAQKLVSAPIPVVAVADAAQDISSVVVDDAAGSRMIVDYLVQKGHQRVLYRRGRPHQSSERRRYEAFMITSAKAGLAVVEDFDRPANFAYTLSEPEIAILHQPDAVRPTVVVCNNDLIAYNTFDYCEAAHIRVPEDLAIIGFDGMVPQVRTAAALTTIRAPWFQVAKTALDLVMRRLDGEAIPLETMLPVELVVGKTA